MKSINKSNRIKSMNKHQSTYRNQSNHRLNHQLNHQPNHHPNQWNRFIFYFIFIFLLIGLGCGIHRPSIKAQSEPAIKKSSESKSTEPEKEKPVIDIADSAALPAQPDGIDPDGIGKEKKVVLKNDSSTPRNDQNELKGANEPAINEAATNEPAIKEANKPGGKETDAPEKETLLSSSLPSRPDWIGKETALKDGYLTLAGISGDCATEKLSLDEAMKDTQAKIVKYLGGLAKLEFLRMTVSDNLASKIIDPNSATRSYQEFLAADIARRNKESETYREEWITPAGVVYRSFVLVRMPQAVIDNSMRGFTRYNAVKARQAVKNTTDKKAKKLARKTIEFWMNVDPGILTK